MSNGTDKRKSHPVRLAILMLSGMVLGVAISLSPFGHSLDIGGAGLLIFGALGVLAGLACELCLQGRIAVEFIMAVFICSALALVLAAAR
jgi:hypothetical protein